MTDTQLFQRGMTLLIEALDRGRILSDALTDVYWRAMQDVSDQAFERAAERALLELKFFPKPAELRELAGVGVTRRDDDLPTDRVTVRPDGSLDFPAGYVAWLHDPNDCAPWTACPRPEDAWRFPEQHRRACKRHRIIYANAAPTEAVQADRQAAGEGT